MNREALDRWCERGILALVLVILLLGPLSAGAVRTFPFLVIQGLTVGVLLLWGTRLWLNSRAQLLWPPICWAVLAFTVYAILRYFTADIEYVARLELIRILVYASLFFALINNLHRQESVQIISCTLIFLAMVVALYAGYQFITRSTAVWHFYAPPDFAPSGKAPPPVTRWPAFVDYGRQTMGASGTYISHNHLGGLLEMLLPLGLAYTLISRFKAVPKVIFGYASLVILAGIVVSISRGAYAGTLVALALFFGVLLFHRTYRLPSLVLLVMLLAAGAYYLPKSFPVKARIKPLVEGGNIDRDTRIELWRAALQLWEQDIWWGVGPAHYDYRFRQFRPADVQMRPGWAHNDYINALAEWGIVGVCLISAAWLLLGVGVFKTWPFVRGKPRDIGREKGSNKFAFVLGASLGLLAILVHSGVDFNMHIPANAILAVALMALLSSHLRFATERYWVRIPPWVRPLASGVVLAGVACLGLQGWRHTREYVWLQRAAHAPEFSPRQAELLEKAFAIEPKNPDTAYAIGEAYRIESAEGGDNYRELAKQAMDWYERVVKLNPWSSYGYMRYGWCLDWLGQTAESQRYFDRAAQLEPNGYYVAANIGLHYVATGDLAAAKQLFERSLHLESKENDIARTYLQIVRARMMEAATNEFSAKLSAPPH